MTWAEAVKQLQSWESLHRTKAVEAHAHPDDAKDLEFPSRGVAGMSTYADGVSLSWFSDGETKGEIRFSAQREAVPHA